MGKPRHEPGRLELPSRWHWAKWSGTKVTCENWISVKSDYGGKIWARLELIAAAIRSGRPIDRTRCHFTDGIGKAKIFKPSPGVRVYFFQDGSDYFITQITWKKESKKDHKEQIEIGKQARTEHKSGNKKNET